MNQFSTNSFSYDKLRKEFFTEASDLEGFAPGLDVSLRSQWTGETKVFTYVGPKRDLEGEVLTWEYAAPGLSLGIAND